MDSFIREQQCKVFNQSSLLDPALKDLLGCPKWPPLVVEKIPWTLKEAAKTKKQLAAKKDQLIMALQNEITEILEEPKKQWKIWRWKKAQLLR